MFLVQITVTGMAFKLCSSKVHFLSNQKVVGFSHDIHATIAPVSMSYQASHRRSSQCLQLGKTDDHFTCLLACPVPSSTANASQPG